MRTLVIGGAASGKSEWAEDLAVRLPAPRLYLATLAASDPESLERIHRHQVLRAGKGFSSMDRPVDLAGLVLDRQETILLECLGTLAANELFMPGSDRPSDTAMQAVLCGIDHLSTLCSHLIVVSNDVFADGTAYAAGTHDYLMLLSDLNRRLSMQFERVIEVVCGIPLLLKGELP